MSIETLFLTGAGTAGGDVVVVDVDGGAVGCLVVGFDFFVPILVSRVTWAKWARPIYVDYELVHYTALPLHYCTSM